MDLTTIHQCLGDVTRQRIVHLLAGGPLCVCHLQDLLDAPQVKISKHLRYLRERGMVEAERHGAWMIYRLPRRPTRQLAAHLACLQACVSDDPVYSRDAKRAAKLRPRLAAQGPLCGC